MKNCTNSKTATNKDIQALINQAYLITQSQKISAGFDKQKFKERFDVKMKELMTAVADEYGIDSPEKMRKHIESADTPDLYLLV